jgi:hypothetical protein
MGFDLGKAPALTLTPVVVPTAPTDMPKKKNKKNCVSDSGDSLCGNRGSKSNDKSHDNSHDSPSHDHDSNGGSGT